MGRRNHFRAYCSRCRHTQSFVRNRPNHWLHLGLSILTFGLWAISWISLTIGLRRHPWRCEHCGWQRPLSGPKDGHGSWVHFYIGPRGKKATSGGSGKTTAAGNDIPPREPRV